MKIAICIIGLCSILSNPGYCQNLVPNPGFESYSGCPTSFSQFGSVHLWYNPTASTPDYFNQCSSTVGVPFNIYGYQPAHGGGAYAGIVTWALASFNFREYIAINLSNSLIANTCYYFEMFVNLPDENKYSTSSVGVYFSDILITGVQTNQVLPYTPQIVNTSGIAPDTMNWSMVSGTFTASGGENYMIIGNFNDDLNTTATLINNSGQYNNAFVYIDDVLLTACTGVVDHEFNTEIKIFPNPFSDLLTVTTKYNSAIEVVLYDISSRKVLQQQLLNTNTLNTSDLMNGVYYYELKGADGILKRGKIIKASN